MDGVAKLVAAGGTLPALNEDMGKSFRSPRRKGVEQGVILTLVGILLLPLVNVVVSPPYNEALLSVFLIGGILRAVYALVFQEGPLRRLRQSDASPQTKDDTVLSPSQTAMLNSGEKRLETAEIIELPDTVTENTTKLLNEKSNRKNQ